MPATQDALPEVYSAAEIARAAGVRLRDAQAAFEVVVPIADGYFTERDAVRVVRQLAGRSPGIDRTLFRPAAGVRRQPALPIALTAVIHVAIVGLLGWMTSLAMAKPTHPSGADRNEMRLVFLMAPRPGGGGGGGGRREPAPPPKAERTGISRLRSPLPIRRPPPRIDPPPVVHATLPPPPVKAEPLPPIVAPVVPAAADTHERVGMPAEVPPREDSHGPGSGGGVGTGPGTGIGEGDGPGLGPGSGGGTGGGPYRAGAGITPPQMVREVRPDYTDEGRRRGLEGEVLLEIVVRRDGSVGDVKVLQGLGAGLDQRAIDAVRQWRFSPATRLGAPVDVIAQVSVEFKLR